LDRTFPLCMVSRSLCRRCPFTATVVTHFQGRGRRSSMWMRLEMGLGMGMGMGMGMELGMGWRLWLWVDNYDVATIPAWQPELRRRVLGLRLWLQVSG